MYEVTIAIPVYNVEQYILKSMKSALSQTFQSIEFLIIDDKGADGSMDIIYRLQLEHLRGKDIRVISNEKNIGISECRNIALREASGKFFFFMDSDDYISEDCIERLYNTIITEKVELVISSYVKVSDGGEIKERFLMPEMVVCKADELATLRFGKLHHLLMGFCWNILYDLSFIRSNNLSFKRYHKSSDTVFCLDLFPLVSSFALLPVITYYYVIRPNSLTSFHVREEIPLAEVKEQISIRDYAKIRIMELKHKPYFIKMSSYVMHYSYNGALALLKNRSVIPALTSTEIKRMISFPLSLRMVLSSGAYRSEFIAYYILSFLPAWCEMIFLRRMMKHYYRKRNEK